MYFSESGPGKNLFPISDMIQLTEVMHDSYSMTLILFKRNMLQVPFTGCVFSTVWLVEYLFSAHVHSCLNWNTVQESFLTITDKYMYST